MSFEGIKWSPVARIEKYSPEVVEELTRILGYEPKDEDFKRMGADPYAITEVEGNMLVNGGLARINNLIIGTGSTAAFNSTQSVIGVGSSSTAEARTQTDLQAAAGAANRWMQAATTAPSLTTVTNTNDSITCGTTFGTSDGNFAWNEWCWVVSTGTITATSAVLSGTVPGSTGNTMLNRKVASMGTKASGSSWAFTTTVTLS